MIDYVNEFFDKNNSEDIAKFFFILSELGPALDKKEISNEEYIGTVRNCLKRINL